MGTVSLSGVVVVGPDGSSAYAFPSAETTIPLIAATSDYAVSIDGLQVVASPTDYADAPGVGTGGTVTQGRFIYARSDAPLLVRLTTTAGVAIVPIEGLLILEFTADAPLTKLEVKGTGRLSYLVAGQS
jgi:hypothetical protein